MTNYPLIPEFSVNGAMAGSTLVVSPGSKMTISARIQSVLPVDTAEIVVNGEVQESVSIPLEGAWTDFQLDRTLAVDESSWIALRVRGQTTVRHASSENLFAHSGPMYVEVDGAPVRRTASAPRFIDWADSLRLFVLARGNITLDQRNEVFERIQASEDTFRSLFQEPPEAFDLLDPAPDAHLNPFLSVLLTWAASHDPEEGDRIVYTCELRDSLGTVASFETADTTFILPNPPLLMGALEWRVIATDLGGNGVTSTGGWRPLTLEPPVSGLPLPGDGLPTEVPEAPERIRIGAHPNPFHAQVELRWMPGDPGPLAGAKVFDAAGRRVRWIGGDAGSGSTPRSDAAPSSSADGARLVWDGRDDRFQQVPPGVYWVRVETSSGQRASVRVTRLR